MQDRVSTYPGRWKLTPVTGQTNIYDAERADDPTVTGTPLNKATFLTDAAAAAVAALGVTSPGLPSEAIAAIAGVLSDMGVSNVAHVEAGSYTGTGTNSTTNYLDIAFSITPKIVFIVAENGSIGNPTRDMALSWVSGQTSVYAYGSGMQSYPVTFSLSSKTLRRRAGSSNTTAADLMNTSGATYYYVGVGLK